MSPGANRDQLTPRFMLGLQKISPIPLEKSLPNSDFKALPALRHEDSLLATGKQLNFDDMLLEGFSESESTEENEILLRIPKTEPALPKITLENNEHMCKVDSPSQPDEITISPEPTDENDVLRMPTRTQGLPTKLQTFYSTDNSFDKSLNIDLDKSQDKQEPSFSLPSSRVASFTLHDDRSASLPGELARANKEASDFSLPSSDKSKTSFSLPKSESDRDFGAKSAEQSSEDYEHGEYRKYQSLRISDSD